MATGKKLTGINPLAYMGVEPTAPPQLVVQPFPPTPADVQNNNIGTLWIVPNSSVWMLVALAGNIATWVQIYPATSGTGEFETDAGNAFPAGGIIEILGGSNINTAGAGNVVTINLDTDIVVDDFEATGNVVIFSGLGASGVLQVDGGGNLSASKGNDGQVLIGSTAGAPAWANITSNDASVTITNGANTIDLSVPPGGIVTLDGDTGSATGATVTIAGGNNINTSAAGATVTINLDNNIDLPAPNVGGTAGYILSNGTIVVNFLGTGDTFLGPDVGNLTHNGAAAQYDTFVGTNIGTGLTTGADNTAMGGFALQDLTSGDSNVAMGVGALQHISNGEFNIGIGTNTGDLMVTGSESSNILIGNRGVNGESNAIRIGVTGGGVAQQDACYIAGIYGVAPGGGGLNMVTMDVNGQLGSQAIPGGGGITTLDGDVGSATGATVTIAGGSNINTSAAGATVTVNLDNTVGISGSMTAGTGFSATTGNVQIVAGNLTLPTTNAALTAGIIEINGVVFMHSGNATANANSFMGGAGNPTTIGAATANTGVGGTALDGLTTGSNNVGVGNNCLESITTGGQNVGVGVGVGSSGLDTGSRNTLIGYTAGAAYTGAETNNICIGALVDGTLGESNAIHIGVQGTATLCTIAGIFGVTVAGGSGTAVFIDNTGQLGTVVSSRRFKDKIEDMGAESNVLHRLRPVSFVMKGDKDKRRQFGLIAEEVVHVIPDMVIQQEGAPYSVKYEMLPVMLLNELQLMYKAMDMHERLIFKLSEKVAQLEQRMDTMSKMNMCD